MGPKELKEKIKDLERLKSDLEDKTRRMAEIREDPAFSISPISWVPGSTSFAKSWDGYRRERTIPLKEDSEYTLDDLKSMLSIIINIAKSNDESEEDIVNMLVDALDEI